MTNYVAYLVLSPSKSALSSRIMFHDAQDQERFALQKKVQQYFGSHPQHQLLETFVEISKKKRARNRHQSLWPELDKAIAFCQETHAHLFIVELRNLPKDKQFSAKIFEFVAKNEEGEDTPAPGFIGDILCGDNYATRQSFHTIHKHFQQQSLHHAELIKQGLARTNAKPGNPNAREVIAQVNKPKVQAAIYFALLLSPVVQEYHRKGYSQRKMVETLNADGFPAPEGGTWVLSQLQKVLDRIKINDVALALRDTFIDLKSEGLLIEEMAEKLAIQGVPTPNGKYWTPELVETIMTRIEQINEITTLNTFLLQVIPHLSTPNLDELDLSVFEDAVKRAGIDLNSQLIAKQA